MGHPAWVYTASGEVVCSETDVTCHETAASPLSKRRLRDAVFPILTLIFAVLWILAALQISRYLDRLNNERFLAGTMAAGASDDSSRGGLGLSSIFTLDSPKPTKEQADRMRRLQEQVGWTQETVKRWRIAMLYVGGFLICVSVSSVFRRLVRVPHLLAGVVIIGGTVVSLIALGLLVDPAAGGLPPLSRWTPVLVALVQGFYGVVLVLVFARRAKAIDRVAAGTPISQ
jgi:hypothetical protein